MLCTRVAELMEMDFLMYGYQVAIYKLCGIYRIMNSEQPERLTSSTSLMQPEEERAHALGVF